MDSHQIFVKTFIKTQIGSGRKDLGKVINEANKIWQNLPDEERKTYEDLVDQVGGG